MQRRETLDALLADRSLEAVWLAQPNSYGWLTGSDNAIVATDPIGVAAAGYDGDSLEIVTANNEADRIREECPEATVRSYAWHDSTLAEAVAERSPTPAAADFDVPGFAGIDVSEHRQPLTESDIERYRSLGQETAAVVEEVCRTLSPDDVRLSPGCARLPEERCSSLPEERSSSRSSETTERAVTAQLRRAFAERGIAVPVALVGGAERVQRHRHFTPTDAELGDYAIVTLCAQRAGLCISITRTVAFDPPAWLDERHHATQRVHATALAGTRAVGNRNGTAGELFGDIKDAYAAVGHPDEWQRHHQGGAGGYATREWIATPESDESVTLPMGYAWNPTVQGAKCEDTVLVTSDGFETLTRTGDWPTTDVRAVGYDVSLPQHDVLVME